jgi:Ca-activated chloride channel family protein
MNRFPSSPASDRDETPFGLIGWLQQTRTILPLRAVDCRFTVTGPAAHVEIDQVFLQANREALDCTYTFPLPGNAAVHRCEITINGRRIEARIEEEGRAEEIFLEKKAEGHRVAMARSERENLFTLDLGNVQPGDSVIVRFAYFQLVERLGETLSLLVPFCPGVRYIPGNPLIRSNRGEGAADDTDQVPDASRISPPRIDAEHPDAAIMRISGSLQTAGAGFANLSSPTHPLLIKAGEGAGSVVIELARGAEIPNRDFIVRWQEIRPSGGARSRGWVCRSERDGADYALAEIVAPAEAAAAPTRAGRDVYFLLDRSGSMQGAKWEKTCEAFLGFLRLLGADDRAWATLFETDFRDLAEVPLPAAKLLSDRAVLNLASLGTAGGTELAPALGHVLAKLRGKVDPRRGSPVLIIITDGQVGNEEEITQMLAEAGDLTVHAFGIDTAVNDAYLRELAQTHGGACALMTPNDDISGAVTALAEQLRHPVLTGLGVGPGWELPDGGKLRDLFARTTTHLLVRRAENPTAPLEIRGSLPDGGSHAGAIELEAIANEAIPLLWIKARIRELQRSGTSEDQAAALALACRHNVLCKGAAFLAWDEAEKAAVARRRLYQPAQEVALCAGPVPCSPPKATQRPGDRGLLFSRTAPTAYRDVDHKVSEEFRPPASRSFPAPPPSAQGEIGTQASLSERIEEALLAVEHELNAIVRETREFQEKLRTRSRGGRVEKELTRWLAELEKAAAHLGGLRFFVSKLHQNDPKILAACEDAAKRAIKDFSRAGLKAEGQLRDLLSMLQRLAAIPNLTLK